MTNARIKGRVIKPYGPAHLMLLPECTEEIMLAHIHDPEARFFAATNPSITERVQFMYLDTDLTGFKERYCLTQNTSVTTNVIEAWIPMEEHLYILRELLSHPNITAGQRETIIQRLIATGDQEDEDEDNANRRTIAAYAVEERDILAALYPTGNESAKLTNVMARHALKNPNCPAKVVLAICYSPNGKVRRIASRHRNCPEEGRIIAALGE